MSPGLSSRQGIEAVRSIPGIQQPVDAGLVPSRSAMDLSLLALPVYMAEAVFIKVAVRQLMQSVHHMVATTSKR